MYPAPPISPMTFSKTRPRSASLTGWDEEDLTNAEWNIILQGEKQHLVDYRTVKQPGEVIFEKGVATNFIYKIHQGTCKICFDNFTAFLFAEEMIGEIQFITENPPTVTVVAENTVELLMIDIKFAREKLFLTHPTIAIKFYRKLISTMAARIETREDQGRRRIVL